MKEEVYIEMNTKKPGTYLDREQRIKTEDKVLLLRKIDPHNYWRREPLCHPFPIAANE